MNVGAFEKFDVPFPHFVAEGGVLSERMIDEMNAEWPAPDQWQVEDGKTARKCAITFPRQLPHTAQIVACWLYSAAVCQQIGAMLGLELLPDPWFKVGPTEPRVGGGLHEIRPGGRLGIHVDFNRHPTGLFRCANLLIYLNRDWRDEWGGALELHGMKMKSIYPRAGTVVLFRTTNVSWHGHPQPLACPPDRARRSLALYYYQTRKEPIVRKTTLYQQA